MNEALAIPQHVALIMDGNGRWATARNLPRFRGHVEGVYRTQEIVEAARGLGIKALTLFTFSTENWQRPPTEVSMLMNTICAVLEKQTAKLIQDNIRIRWVGRREGVPDNVRKGLDHIMAATAANTGLTVNLAFNYGSRLEILDAVRVLACRVRDEGLDPAQIDEALFSDQLYTRGLPDPDLLIRTSGEQRISNFLLWQLSYTEFYFTETLWPDFNTDAFMEAIRDYSGRRRRFGGVDDQTQAAA